MKRRDAQRRALIIVAPTAVVSVAAACALAADDGYALTRDLWLVRCTGWGALVALGSSLCTTPASRLALALAPTRFAPAQFAAFRRALGLTAATLAALHLAVALATYLRGSLGALVEQPFLRAGLAALCVLLVLAATSYPSVVRAARIQLWKPLHRLAYLAAFFALQHVLLSPFAPRLWVIAFFGTLIVFGLFRLLPARRPGAGGESA